MIQSKDRKKLLTGLCLSGALVFMLSIAIPILSSGRASAGEKPSQTKTSRGAAAKEKTTERPAFDLSYVPAKAESVIAIRPNAIFADPALKPLAQLVSKSPLMDMLLPIPFAKLELPLQEIEQVITYTAPSRKLPNGYESSLTATVMVRAAHDFDWLKQIKRLYPNTKEVHQGEQVYYCTQFQIKVPQSGKTSDFTFRYLIRDKRTLVVLSPSLLRTLEKEGAIQRPHFCWDNEWKRVEHGLCAIAFDCRGAETYEPTKEASGKGPVAMAPLPKAEAIAAEMSCADGLELHAFLTCKDNAAAVQARQDVRDYLAAMRFMLRQIPEEFEYDTNGGPHLSALEKQGMILELKLQRAFLQKPRVTRQDNIICVHSTAKMNVAEVVKMFQTMLEVEKKP